MASLAWNGTLNLDKLKNKLSHLDSITPSKLFNVPEYIKCSDPKMEIIQDKSMYLFGVWHCEDNNTELDLICVQNNGVYVEKI